MLLNFAHAPVCFDTLFPGSDCSLPPLLLKGLEGDGKKGGTKKYEEQKGKGKSTSLGGTVSEQTDSVIVAWLF